MNKAINNQAFCIDEGDYDCLNDNPYLIKRYDVNDFF